MQQVAGSGRMAAPSSRAISLLHQSARTPPSASTVPPVPQERLVRRYEQLQCLLPRRHVRIADAARPGADGRPEHGAPSRRVRCIAQPNDAANPASHPLVLGSEPRRRRASVRDLGQCLRYPRRSPRRKRALTARSARTRCRSTLMARATTADVSQSSRIAAPAGTMCRRRREHAARSGRPRALLDQRRLRLHRGRQLGVGEK